MPTDGVGHQAHVDVARPVQWLEDSITAVEKLDPSLLQAITELDVNPSREHSGADVSAGTSPPYTPAFADDDAVTELGYYDRDLQDAASTERSCRLGDVLGHQQRSHLAAHVAAAAALGAPVAVR